MSEYQYYQFQAVDISLSDKQMADLRRLSSRAQITPNSFVNVYHYGDFRGDPVKLVEKYFDGFLYLANWGTRWFMLRVPKKLLDSTMATSYSAGNCLSRHQHGDHLVLSFRSDDEGDYEWAEGEGWLTSLMPIRAALMRGDHRALYLGWLLGAQEQEIGDDAVEPAVPPGLGELDAPLMQLADFLRIDTELIAAAAEASPPAPETSLSRLEIASWISTLPGKEKDRLLADTIADEDPHLLVDLQQRALSAARGNATRASGPPRTAADLIERARALGEARRKKEAAKRARQRAQQEREAAKRRKEYLECLRGKETTLWSKVSELIDSRQAKGYDEAVSLLRDLRDLAEMQEDAAAFWARMTGLHEEHARKTKLVERFRKAKLLESHS
ncbi:MAG: hypothetical protein QNK18_17295 [Gammaproteobacteria bacterium]|nr:hypothetical protein [Gammaproteobacteria bacterium]